MTFVSRFMELLFFGVAFTSASMLIRIDWTGIIGLCNAPTFVGSVPGREKEQAVRD
jgi:hypothetical protein